MKKAQKAAADHMTIAHMPEETKTALGKQGAAVAQRKRTGGLVIPAGKVIGIMDGAGVVERGPSTRGPVTGRDAAVDRGVRLG